MKSSLDINLAAKLRRMGQSEHVEHIEDVRNAYEFFRRTPLKKRSIGKHRCKWKSNIKMDLDEVVCENVDWN